MKRMKVNTDSIGNARKLSNDEVRNLEKAIADMDKSVKELNATWKGGNHDEFVARYEERYKLVQNAQQMLDEYLQGVATAVKKYEQCESEVSGLASF